MSLSLGIFIVIIDATPFWVQLLLYKNAQWTCNIGKSLLISQCYIFIRSFYATNYIYHFNKLSNPHLRKCKKCKQTHSATTFECSRQVTSYCKRTWKVMKVKILFWGLFQNHPINQICHHLLYQFFHRLLRISSRLLANSLALGLSTKTTFYYFYFYF